MKWPMARHLLSQVTRLLPNREWPSEGNHSMGEPSAAMSWRVPACHLPLISLPLLAPLLALLCGKDKGR